MNLYIEFLTQNYMAIWETMLKIKSFSIPLQSQTFEAYLQRNGSIRVAMNFAGFLAECSNFPESCLASLRFLDSSGSFRLSCLFSRSHSRNSGNDRDLILVHLCTSPTPTTLTIPRLNLSSLRFDLNLAAG